jgi:hypothetical protein
MHYVHERHYGGALNRELAVAHNPDLLLVPSLFFSLALTLIVVLQILLHFHYLYTVHDLPVYVPPLSIRRVSYAMSIDGFKGWFKLIYKDGWKCMFL